MTTTEESNLDSPTLTEMKTLASAIAQLRDDEKAAAEAKSKITADLESYENRAVEILMNNGLTSFKAPDGLLSLGFRLSARLPQGEEKAKLFAHLKSIGLFEEMASINSNTFNSWVKEQYELAQERGEGEPTLPGVTEVKTVPRLSFRRTR